jgi:hypothetical protein
MLVLYSTVRLGSVNGKELEPPGNETMRVTSILINIVGILLIVRVAFNVISYLTKLPLVIPYFSIWGTITCLVLACVAGARSKRPRFIVGSILYLAMDVVLIFIPSHEPGYPLLPYAILSYVNMGMTVAGLIVLAIDAFKEENRRSGIIATVAVGAFGAYYLLSYLIPVNIVIGGGNYYFGSIPIDYATFFLLMSTPVLVMYTSRALAGVHFITRRLDDLPAVNVQNAAATSVSE